MRYRIFERILGRAFFFSVLSLSLMIGVLSISAYDALAQSTESQKGINKIVAIDVDAEGERSVVHIKTLEPVGYRYSVYDSLDPVRVVIDFPGIDIAEASFEDKVEGSPVEEIRVSAFDLSSGKLGRVELLLSSATNYDVSLDGNDFAVSFNPSHVAELSTTGEKITSEDVLPEVKQEEEPVTKEMTDSTSLPEVKSDDLGFQESMTTASAVVAVTIEDSRAILGLNGSLDRHQYFTLGAPPRLVVDLYGVKPKFKKRYFDASQGIGRIRVGTYPEKTRFVFDAEQGPLPKYQVKSEEDAIIVAWGEEAAGAAIAKPSIEGIPVTVEAVEFEAQNGKSILSVDLSGPAEVSDPAAEGDLVRFGIKNALISRSLRRTIDASAFPSAVRLVTPYTVQEDGSQDVLFAIELKGPVTYSLQKKENGVKFVVDNGPFDEVAPPAVEEVKEEVPVSATAEQPVKAVSAAVTDEPVEAVTPTSDIVEKEQILGKQPSYVGQKISLVFDDADIRKILQLIAEVSNLNIIAGDEISGTITLRLIDVPWDQALDLIMEIKGLGMLRDGNVVRVLPEEKIREMRQAQLNAVKVERELEPLVTETISVSYTDLKNVSGPSRELLSNRGKLTDDSRNKQIIVTDIPLVIAEIRRLINILDTPERQVMIEARIVEADTTFSQDLGVNWGLSYSKTNTGLSNISQSNIGLGGGFVLPPGGVGIGDAAGLATSLTFGELGIDSTVLDLQISALETSGRGKVVSKPRVTTLNGEKAVISQGTKIPYQTISDQGIKTEFVDAVLSLQVTPVINPDNSIILDIEASNSSIGDNVSTGAGSAPAVDTKEAKTKLLLQDGQTSVLGGILIETDRESEAGVPFLRKLPLLGHLFKSTNTIKDHNELLVFITPRIVQ